MKTIMVMFDSLNLRYLNSYGGNKINTPNFNRLAKKSTQFQNHYVGSMPCMPARRELHTGRYNFLHRSWGPIEPFDESIFETLRFNGIYTHLISDHTHYWEDGGATYHTRYSSFEFVRGQEGDTWKANLSAKPIDSDISSLEDTSYKWVRAKTHDAINRSYMGDESKMSQTITFDKGIEFINTNIKEDNWFLQIETFDPHEPFFAAKKYQDQVIKEKHINQRDWPPYFYLTEAENVIESVREHYCALIAQCDANLGRILDIMDQHNMWEDTMLIVNTDHGYLLGEHGWWSKSVMPMYNEIAHIPLFIYHPNTHHKGVKRETLTQSIDIPSTILDFFNLLDKQDFMMGKSLIPVIKSNEKIRDYALFGDFGRHVNITDSKTVYMRGPSNYDNNPLFEYTLMPTHMKSRFTVNELIGNTDKWAGTELVKDQFQFMKGVPVLKIPTSTRKDIIYNFGNRLYNLEDDPKQNKIEHDAKLEVKMINAMIKELHKSDAPLEQFIRLGLPKTSTYSEKNLAEDIKNSEPKLSKPNILNNYKWTDESLHVFNYFFILYKPTKKTLIDIESSYNNLNIDFIDCNKLIDVICDLLEDKDNEIKYILKLASRKD